MSRAWGAEVHLGEPTYFLAERTGSGSFSQPLTRTGALYFSVNRQAPYA